MPDQEHKHSKEENKNQDTGKKQGPEASHTMDENAKLQPDKSPDKQPDKSPDKQLNENKGLNVQDLIDGILGGKRPDKQPDKSPDKQPDKSPDKQPDKSPDKQPDKSPDKQPAPSEQLRKIISKTDALKVLKELETKYGEYIFKRLGLSSSEGKEAIMKVLPSDLTRYQLEDFVRKSQHFLSEKGKIQTGQILGWSLNEVQDRGFKGKSLEHMIQFYGSDILKNLNEISENFPVVDAINNKTRDIISIARGTPEYLWDKIQVLFNVKITKVGVESANLAKFDNMLTSLRKEGEIKSKKDYTNRARLMVPDYVVLPFKDIIAKRVKDPILREQMLKAIINEL